ncbi:MAG: IS3 family transposase, partial [Acidobacteria bacterium]|nr:IS3 family transposase [Acidobacteriota bacterium]
IVSLEFLYRIGVRFARRLAYSVNGKVTPEEIGREDWTAFAVELGMARRPLLQRLRELAQIRVAYGYRRLHVLLRQEGLVTNRKKTERLYREERLTVRRRRGRKRSTWSSHTSKRRHRTPHRSLGRSSRSIREWPSPRCA